MIVYIKNHPSFAGHWIYNKGFFSAWKQLGYEVILYNNLNEIKESSSDYYIMATDGDINKNNLRYLDKSKKTFLYVQPNNFELPWSRHPNFICNINDETIESINNIDNVIKWSFADVKKEYYYKWNRVFTSQLAFDSVNYSNFIKDKEYEFDVCFIGSRANNGFDEKIKIMYDVFKEFIDSGLNCGFFIDSNLPHDIEKNIIFNSKVSLNIHDAYQRNLGLDTNERTFKSLGINGILVSDKVKQLESLFNFVETDNNPKNMVNIVKNILNLTELEIQEKREANKNFILNNHTYVQRVKNLLTL